VTNNVVAFAPHYDDREADKGFMAMLSRSIQAAPDSVVPIPKDTINRMAAIQKKLDEARNRLHKEEM